MISDRSRFHAALASALIALPLAALHIPAHAQNPAPAGIPVANCGERPPHPGNLGSDRQKNQWAKETNAHIDCLRKYAAELRKAFDAQQEITERYRQAANAAAQATNDAIKAMQADAEAAQ